MRWRRMSGYNTVWVPGTDHAGIATQVRPEGTVLRGMGAPSAAAGMLLPRRSSGQGRAAGAGQQGHCGSLQSWLPFANADRGGEEDCAGAGQDAARPG